MSKKYLIISIFAILFPLYSNAQNIDSLIRVGNTLRSSSNPQEAIKTYREILEIEKNSSLANYEMAYTYLILKDYNRSIKYSNRVIKSKSKKTIAAYVMKGSALDYMGRQKKSIRLYNYAIKLYPNNYLLHFNLGVTYYNNNQPLKAKYHFLKSIEIDKLQPSSHLVLGLLMNDTGDRVQSMLSLYFFLMLEPNSERSVEAHKLLMSLWERNVEVDSTKPNSYKIVYKPKKEGDDFNAVDLSISSIYARSIGANRQDKNDCLLLTSNTVSFFGLMGDYKNLKNDIWHNLYITFFNDLFVNNQAEPFCYYISNTCDNTVINSWLEFNRDKIEAFSLWVNERIANN
jgi:tetratricopeptide (TPR) repeat protein